MDLKVVGVVFSGVVAVVTSPQLLDVVWCSAVAVVDTVVKRVVQIILYCAQGLAQVSQGLSKPSHILHKV